MTRILVTICARGGSKGLPSKNIRPILGKPLIAHSIELAKSWPRAGRVVVSTDSEEIAKVARAAGADVPFLRPAELATDTAAKVPVLHHAFSECRKVFGEDYDAVVDLDPTSPLRRLEDLDRGWEVFERSKKLLCFSVTRARKNPYFNMVERGEDQKIRLVKPTAFTRRQAAPAVWDMNASIYVYSREFFEQGHQSLWAVESEIIEMPPESAFDIDEERDFIITEALMRRYLGTAP